MRKASLFSGIGGIDLAAHWAGMETVMFCEREPYCQRVLRKHWPDVPIIDDVRDVTREELIRRGIIGGGRTIDLISAGYPCQPFSHAGKRRGAEDDRHLWPEVRRILHEIRPRWFVGENVAGHITLGLDDVLSDLENEGYTAQPFVIPAAAVGAPHRRDRVFIVAYAEGFRREFSSRIAAAEQGSPKIIPDSRWFSKGGETLADACSAGRKERHSAAVTSGSGYGPRSGNPFRADWATQPGVGRGIDVFPAWLDGGVNPLDALAEFIAQYPQPALMGQPQYDWEPPRVATGVKNRAARLKALGNAVNPLQIYPIMYAIRLIDDWLRRGAG